MIIPVYKLHSSKTNQEVYRFGERIKDKPFGAGGKKGSSFGGLW